MKIYSSETVTRSEVNDIDKKQTEQIKKLRIIVGAAFLANVALTVLLHFIK